MKLLMTADTVGGVWTYAMELARALSPGGVEVVLAVRGGALSAGQRKDVRAIDGLTVEESTLKLEWMDDPWSDVERGSDWLLELEAKHAPDLVHLNDYAHGALPWRAPVLVVAHSCVLSWFEAVKRSPAPAHWNRYREVVTRGLRGAGLVVAPSHAMLRVLGIHYGFLPNTAVIRNGRRPARSSPTTKEPFILSAGRLWDDAKNAAALETVSKDLSWPVYLAGDAGELPSGGCARLGRLPPEKLARWMRRAAVYALPARYEPFGLSVLEAAQAGCALVLGDIPSLRELWDGAAAFVPPDEPAELAQALGNLERHPHRLAALSRAAAERSRSYGPDRMAASYLDRYRELIAARNDPIRSGGPSACAR